MRKANQVDRLAMLDEMNRQAREALTRERARGVLIGWMNDFKRLDRFLNNSPPAMHSADYPFFIGRTVAECASFEYDHLQTDDAGLAAILEDYEENLAGKIISSAHSQGFRGRDVEDAVTFLAKKHKLDVVISYLEFLLRQLEQ